ncbi:MAG: hypothetical protein GQ572_01725 [Gammaproteobacteria bacterium]|nr:hypothetical protein [Gammaproteobacteria bacterium]
MMKNSQRLIIVLSLLFHINLYAEESLKFSSDPHYNDIGFFDIHICNWPERPNFFKILFSSEKYDQIESMDVYTPDDHLLVNLDKTRFKILKRKNKPNKKVYMLDIDIPEQATTGWYKIDVKSNDGTIYHAKDYVIMTRLEQVSRMHPSDENKEFNLPITLKWDPVAGSQHYQAFVRDVWTEKLVFRSKLIETPEIKIPDNKLEPGGEYYWVVHSRDTNEHLLLGDFHMGSLSKKTYFTVAE